MLQVELPGVFVMEISLAGGAPLEPDKQSYVGEPPFACLLKEASSQLPRASAERLPPRLKP